jgi:choline kinase
MKVIILAAGYGTRLQRDIENDPQYKHLLGVPKPLVPVGGECLISRWMKIIKTDLGEGQTDCEMNINKVCVVVS